MNITKLLQSIIDALKLANSFGLLNTHETAERALTIPARDRNRIIGEMKIPVDQREHAHELFRRFADALSDLVLFLVTHGKLDADED